MEPPSDFESGATGLGIQHPPNPAPNVCEKGGTYYQQNKPSSQHTEIVHWCLTGTVLPHGSVSRKVNLTSWEGAPLAGCHNKNPYREDFLLQGPTSHSIFSYWVG